MDPAYNIGEAAANSQIVVGSHNTLNQKNIETNIEKFIQAAPKPKPTGAINNLPFSGSDTFVGREQAIADLRDRLAQGDAVAITAIQGMGGIGKTELAQQESSDELIQAYCQVMVAIAKQIPQSPTRELIVNLTSAVPHIAETTTQWQDRLGDED